MKKLRDLAPRLLFLAAVLSFCGSLGVAAYQSSKARQELSRVRSVLLRTNQELATVRDRKQVLVGQIAALSGELAALRTNYDALRAGSEELVTRLEKRGIQQEYVHDAVEALRTLIAQGPRPPGSSSAQALPTWFVDQLRAYVAQSSGNPEPLKVLAGNDARAAIAVANGLLDRAPRTHHRDELEFAERLAEQAVTVGEGSLLLDALAVRGNARLTLALETPEHKKGEYLRGAQRDFDQVATQDRRSLRGFEAYEKAVRCVRLLGAGIEPVIAAACDEAAIEGLPHRANHCAEILWEDSAHQMKLRDLDKARARACKAADLFDATTYPDGDKRHLQLEDAKRGARARCEDLQHTRPAPESPN